MNVRAMMYPAILAAALMSTPASAAPVAPLPSEGVPLETVQFRGGNWRDHPMMYPGYYEWHQRQWDLREGRGPYARVNRCARLRGYDPATHTYRNRNGRRVPCPR